MKSRSWGNATGYNAQRERRQNRAKAMRVYHRLVRETQKSDAKAAPGEKPAELGMEFAFYSPGYSSSMHRGVHRQLRTSKRHIPKFLRASSHLQRSSLWAEPPLCTPDLGGSEQALG